MVQLFECCISCLLSVLLLAAFKDFSGAFMPRQGIPAPHCFTFQRGSDMCRQYKDMLPAVEPSGVYCCVKSFVRDVKLQQPPLLCLRPSQLQKLTSPHPTEILERRPLSEREIHDAVQLSKLCESKYDMPRAAAALKEYVACRDYTVPALSWLLRRRIVQLRVARLLCA